MSHCLLATEYIATHANGIMRRDAGRLLVIATLGFLKLPRICTMYRESVHGMAASLPEMSELADIVGNELRRLSPELFQAIALQPPLVPSELAAARAISVRHFDPDVLERHWRQYHAAQLRPPAMLTIIQDLLSFLWFRNK